MSIEGLKIVVTGTFSRGRKEIEGELEDAGADVTGSVSGKTDILICGEAAGSKLAKAQKLGLPILDEAQLDRLLGGDTLQKVLKGGGTKAKAKPGTPKPSGKKPTKVPESGATLDGLKVVCTGTFSQPRKELEARLEDAGADVTGSFSGKTQLLVVGEKAGSKLARAEKAGIPVINEEQAEALLGGATLDAVIGGKAPKKAAKKKAAPKKAAKKKAAPKEASGGGLSIEGLKIVVTGKFETPRKELEAALEELGADVTGSFSGKTQLLVAGEKVGSKLGKAQKAGIPIIDEAQLSELLEGASLASILG